MMTRITSCDDPEEIRKKNWILGKGNLHDGQRKIAPKTCLYFFYSVLLHLSMIDKKRP